MQQSRFILNAPSGCDAGAGAAERYAVERDGGRRSSGSDRAVDVGARLLIPQGAPLRRDGSPHPPPHLIVHGDGFGFELTHHRLNSGDLTPQALELTTGDLILGLTGTEQAHDRTIPQGNG
jgi:hypothetical protein